MYQLPVNESEVSEILRSQRRRRDFATSVGIALGTIAANALAYFLYHSIDTSQPQLQQVEAARQNNGNDGTVARAYRLAGLQAMARGDYEVAIIELKSALKQQNAPDDVQRLIGIANRLLSESRQESGRQKVATTPVPAPFKALSASIDLKRGSKPKAEGSKESPPEPGGDAADADPRDRKLSGTLPLEVVRRVVARQGKGIRACYTSEAQGQTAGQVVVSLVVAPHGEVREGRIESSTLSNQSVERCIEREIRKLKFPAPEGGAANLTFALPPLEKDS